MRQTGETVATRERPPQMTLEESREEVRRLREALAKIVGESGSDIDYSWCQIHLKRVHKIAREALGTE